MEFTNNGDSDAIKVRRASFDIGSGSIKMQCSDCVITTNHNVKIMNILSGKEIPVSFGADYMRNGYLSDEIQEKGVEIISYYINIAKDLNVQEFSGIATEVFRKANNGILFLKKVEHMGIPVVLLTQEMEAEVGYGSVMAMGGDDIMKDLIKNNKINVDRGCVWDSGGASFQITTYDHTKNPPKLLTFMGCYGTSITTALLVKQIQKRELVKNISSNPVTKDHSMIVIQSIKSSLDSPVPAWLLNRDVVFSASGRNSIFKLCCDILTISRNSDVPIISFTLSDAEEALDNCLERSDEELYKYVDFEHSDGPGGIVPKLCLLVAVLQYAGIKTVYTVTCIGSCAGVMRDARRW